MHPTARAAALLLALGVPAAPALAQTLNGQAPLVIGHRGASGYRPEHTLEAYRLAIALGADFIEPDLVPTKDGVLVARHENALAILNPNGTIRERTTDINDLPQFANRLTTKTIDGVQVRGWFTEDLTLAELKTLRAVERLPQLRPNNTQFDGQFQVPTFQEVIDLAKSEGARLGRTIGIYPETKHPSYFKSIGLPLEQRLVDTLNANGYTGPNASVFVQSFEVSNLVELNGLTDVPLVQLINSGGRPYDFVLTGDSRTYTDMLQPGAAGLDFINDYANGIGPEKGRIIPRDAQNNLLAPTSLVGDAHAAGLLVHPFTFRNENNFLPIQLRLGDPADPTYLRQWGDYSTEYVLFFRQGVDGLFSDFSDAAVNGRFLASVPEPGAFGLLGAGGAALLALRRRRKN